MSRLGPVTIVFVLALSTALLASTKFTSVWKAPEATGVSFAGKKVAALVISADDNLRVSGEEALSRQLATRGMTPVASYRMVPREELRDPAKARPWYERSGVDGVVAMRVVSAGKEQTYVPGVWSTPYYSSLWGYYGYGWGAVYDPGYIKEDMVVVIETLIFSVPKDKLLWAGVSESTNPKNAERLLEDLVKTAVKEMQKQGLIRQ